MFRPIHRRQQSSVGSLRLLAAIAVIGVLALPLLEAAPPSWWTTRNVITPGANANDYAAINQGQLKNLATTAAAELDASLPGGTGGPTGAVHELIDPWATSPASANDYAAVNLGQLKQVAQPFYDVLIAAGYTGQYPWIAPGQTPSDYATANLGQAKNLFSFDVAASSPGGLPNWWLAHYGLPANTDPNAQAAGSGLTYLQKYQLGLNPLVASTMGDSFTDGWKVKHLLNPHHKMLGDTNGTALALQVFTPLKQP